jgi:plastocyanin
MRMSLGLACVVMAGLTLIGCGEDRNDALGKDAPKGVAPVGGTAVNGVEAEWSVQIDLASVKAGPVTFTFKNAGKIVHEMLIVKTDLPVGTMPVDPIEHRFNEESPQWEVVKEISEYDAGTTKALTLTLEPGNYQLVCNVPGHYANGMAAAFTVTD